ncbi:hypothetical protein [Rhodococcus sp. C3V]|nr:hypothetical protein [Rhodococcus sp. C3V]MDF3317289.1 hypothetical protein [Rhodococcus sp. C3V]
MDGLSDLVLAADEATAIPIGDAVPSGVLTCAFDLGSARALSE